MSELRYDQPWTPKCTDELAREIADYLRESVEGTDVFYVDFTVIVHRTGERAANLPKYDVYSGSRLPSQLEKRTHNEDSNAPNAPGATGGDSR